MVKHVVWKLKEAALGNSREPSADVVLTTVHESWQALEVYQNHPEHKAAGEFIGQVRETRACVDWEN